MIKPLLLALTLLTVGSAAAQSKLNPAARFMIHQAKAYPSRNADDVRVSALVKLQPGQDISALQQEGVAVLTTRGQFAVISLPLEKAEAIAANPVVQAMSFGQEAKPVMNEARPASFVNTLQQGINNGFTKNYRGEGILLGMMDQGFDPNHINFYNKELTENRIIAMTTILGNNTSITTDYKTPEDILKFGTENASSTHATHVAGIMGGGYNSIGNVAVVERINTVRVREMDVPYYGVAPDAQMYPCVGTLYNDHIMLAADLFAKKAKELGKPGVFNLSVGYVPGPHDGTDLLNQALAEIGKDIIICVAAGNDGTENVSLQSNFATTQEVKTILNSTNKSKWSGEIDTWSDNSNRFAMSFAMIDKISGKIVDKIDIPEIIPAGKVFYISNDNSQGSTHNSTFKSSFAADSYVWASSEVNSENNRFNLSIYLDLTSKGDSKVVPALIYSGSGNIKINSFAGSGLTFSNEVENRMMDGFTAGNPDQSINNIACGENIIAVGAYITKVKWPVLSKDQYMYTNANENQVGCIADFTSYGNLLPNGKTLPEICAPGMGVVSSYSQYYVESEKVGDNGLTADAITTVNTPNNQQRNNPYGLEQGTSMATPYVTGTVALLLEANPSLKVEDVRNLLTSTAIKQDVTGSVATQWGAGKLNAEEAMKKLLGMPSEIGNVSADTERRFAVSVTSGNVEAIVAGEKNLTAKLFSIAGACVTTEKSDGESINISTASLPKGVYVLTVTTPAGVKVSKSILVE